MKPSFRNAPEADVRNPESYNDVIWCLVPRSLITVRDKLRGDVVWIPARVRRCGRARDDEFETAYPASFVRQAIYLLFDRDSEFQLF